MNPVFASWPLLLLASGIALVVAGIALTARLVVGRPDADFWAGVERIEDWR
jgi:hypothetical protein